MNYKYVAYVDGSHIKVRYAPYLFQRFRGIPTSRHYAKDPEAGRTDAEFYFSATPKIAYTIHTTCVDLSPKWTTPEFDALVAEGRRLTYNRFRANNQPTFEGPKWEANDGFVSVDGWAYQDEAYARIDDTDGLALFMEPGCGKTKVVVDYIANHEDVRTVLVVGPKNVIDEGEWHRQIEQHWPTEGREYDVLPLTAKYYGSVKDRNTTLKAWLKEDGPSLRFVLMNYQSIWREPIAKTLLALEFDVVVMDESHYIKSPGSKVSKFAERLADVTRTKFLLTGTPYPNNPLDIFGQFRFLDKTVFGTNFNAFKNRYAVYRPVGPDGITAYSHMDPEHEEEFERKIDAFSIRVKQRPFPVFHQILEYDLPPSIQRKYREMEKDFFTYINGRDVEASNVLARLIRLQQLSAGFTPVYTTRVKSDGTEEQVVDYWETVHTEKRDYLKGLLEDLPKEKPIVVFALYQEHMNQVKYAVESVKYNGRNLRYGEVSGRASDYHKYLNGEIDVICIQINSASEGLNDMVRSDICIFYATGYYSGKYEQAVGRLARPGQESDRILFYHIHGRGTIEGQIYEAVRDKVSISKKFMGGKPRTNQP